MGVQWVFLGGFQAGVDHLSQTEVHTSPSHLIKKWTLPIVTRGDEAYNIRPSASNSPRPWKSASPKTEKIQQQYSNKLPLFLEKTKNSRLPDIQKNKCFCVYRPHCSGLHRGLRKKLTDGFFVFVNGKRYVGTV